MLETYSSLPFEIIGIIAANTESSVTLRNLACCSHAFYHLAIPYMYEHVELKPHRKNYCLPGCHLRSEDVYVYLRNFAYLLLERSDLASYVRHFTMSKDFSVGNKSRQLEREGHIVPTVDVDNVFKSAIKTSSRSVDEKQLWLKHASWTDMDDSILALLLPVLINLTRLDLMAKDSVYVERMIGRARQRKTPFNTQPAFTSLTSFKYSGGIDPNYIA